ncbi:sensor histidine kinase [Poseidonibacter antarcticus]|uniref:sensor histidine kinase n=1 Tax=Poseidonibacter antarcticus TaxID=2478538 RepID=UPI000EF48810|nr:HAMP domain-containing sensor histidine kinase [Poseidonibacter antarcticus]
MKNKYFLILLNIIISYVSLYFTYTLYENYKKEQESKINTYLDKRIKINKSFIKNAFVTIHNEIESNKKIFLQIHKEAIEILRKDGKINIEILKQKLEKKYNMTNVDFHLFYINKNYLITESTYINDIGFDLSLVPDARKELNRTKVDGLVYQSNTISIDIINSNVKSYSYAKVDDSFYLEIGFINFNIKDILKDTMKNIQTITDKRSQLYRIEQKLDDTEYYDNVLDKKTHLSKEDYIKSRKKFNKYIVSDNPIINSNRKGRIIKRNLEDAIVFYIPLIKKNNEYLVLMGDFVLELYIDMKYEKQLDEKIRFYFYIFILIHLSFLIILYFFTKKYHISQLALEKEKKVEASILEENKEFIILMKDHMRMPLRVIMNNFSFLEKDLSKKLHKYLTQINSAINMLKKSYDDLEYLSTDNQVIYKSTCVNLSSFIQERIDFFSSIAQVQNRILNYTFDKDVYIKINSIELERLIDNNLSNAIKYSQKNSTIYVKLYKVDNLFCLSFASKAEAISDIKKIFIKNYQENKDAKRSLGLGLDMVKIICIKYNIFYEVKYEDEMNVFKYYFKEEIKKQE